MSEFIFTPLLIGVTLNWSIFILYEADTLILTGQPIELSTSTKPIKDLKLTVLLVINIGILRLAFQGPTNLSGGCAGQK